MDNLDSHPCLQGRSGVAAMTPASACGLIPRFFPTKLSLSQLRDRFPAVCEAYGFEPGNPDPEAREGSSGRVTFRLQAKAGRTNEVPPLPKEFAPPTLTACERAGRSQVWIDGPTAGTQLGEDSGGLYDAYLLDRAMVMFVLSLTA